MPLSHVPQSPSSSINPSIQRASKRESRTEEKLAYVKVKHSPLKNLGHSIVDALSSFFTFFSLYVLGVSQEWSKDKRVRVLLLIFVDLYVCFISVPYVGLHLAFGNFYPAIPVATVFPVLALNMIIFRVVKSDQLMALIYFLEMYICIFGVAWVMGGYQHSGAAISWLTIGNLCIFVFDMKLKPLWLCFYWVCAIASYVVDMVVVSQPQGLKKVRESISFGYANVTLSGTVMILAFVFFRRSIMKQVKLAQSVTKSVAQLQLYTSELNKLCSTDERNLYELEKFLKQIVINVREYVPYLPPHLLMVSDSSSEQSDEEKEAPTLQHESVIDSQSDTAYNSDRMSSSGIDSMHNALKKKYMPRKDQQKTPSSNSKRIKEGLHQRELVNLVTDISGFHRLCNFNETSVVEDVFTQYIEAVEGAANRNGGIVHFFSGDRVTVSFNSAKRCISPELKAVSAGIEIMKKWKKICEHFHLLDHGVNIAVTKGTGALSGNMGSSTLKRWVNISKSLTLAYELLSVASKHQYGKNLVMISDNVAGEVNGKVRIRFLDVVREPEKPTRHILFEAIDEIEIEPDEWMYEMEQSAKNDKEKWLRNAWIHYLKGNAEESRKLLQNAPPESQKDRNFDRLLNLLDGEVDGTAFAVDT